MESQYVYIPSRREKWEVIHGEYPDIFNRWGEEIEKISPKSRGDTQLSFEKDKDGYIGEKVVDMVIQDWGFQAEFSDLERTNFKDKYRKMEGRCDWDLKWRGQRVDVKTSPINESFDRVFANFNLLIHNKQSDYQEVDDYLFVKICTKRNLYWIIGLINKYQFWGLNQTPKEDWKMKDRECQFVRVEQLESQFRSWVFGVRQ